MSYVDHRCTRCGTAQPGHEYIAHPFAPGGPSELIKTLDGAGKPVSTIEQPGERSFIFGHRTITPCGCASCVALCASLRGAA